MNSQMVVERAYRCLNHKVIYELGRGGMQPTSEWPWGPSRTLDCSGFVMWCLGLSRFDGKKWWDTSAIVQDALTDHTLFEPLDSGREGVLLVYGDNARGQQGHVGLVVKSNPIRVIHCSKGNYTKTKDAIQETNDVLWRIRGGIAVRCLALEET